RLGRRVSFLVCLAVEQVFGLATAFAPDFWSWTACRFLVGLTVPAIYQIPFIISLELVGPSYRSFVTVMTCLSYVGGMLLLTVLAYFFRNWVHLCLVTSLPFFTYVVYWWFANETVYVGLSYYGPALGHNEYLSFFLSSAVEVPSYLLCWIVMDRWGRRWILGVGMIIGGIFSVCTVLVPEGDSPATLILYLVAKFTESAAFLIIYPFAAELYPTEVRGVGIGFSAYVGGLGLVIIPFINYLGTEMLVMPLVIMGLVSTIGGMLTFRLPETLQQKLPNSMAEGESFGQDFTWRDCWACVPQK
ncbi:hypothetical protein OTU49_013229, partial [Cherax quadricarinatus]